MVSTKVIWSGQTTAGRATVNGSVLSPSKHFKVYTIVIYTAAPTATPFFVRSNLSNEPLGACYHAQITNINDYVVNITNWWGGTVQLTFHNSSGTVATDTIDFCIVGEFTD